MDFNLIEYFSDMVKSEFFAGGAGLAIFGTIGYYIRDILGFLKDFAYRRLCTRIKIDNNDNAFRLTLKYLSERKFLRNTRIYKLEERFYSKRVRDNHHDWVENEFLEFAYNPGEGIHWFFDEGCLVILTYEMTVRENKSYDASSDYHQYSFTIFGSSKFKDNLLKKIMEYKKEEDILEAEDNFLYRANMSNGPPWTRVGSIKPRKLDTLITKNNIHLDIIEEINSLDDKKKFYEKRGIPFKRGYLFTGPPGTGKSSLMRVIATACGKGIAPVSLNNSLMTDEILREMIFEVPDNTLIVFEDVDAIFNKREDDNSGISFSGFLNALDGVASQEGNIVLMSTNHIEKLDPALIRPGRIDRIIEVNNFHIEEVLKMFDLFYDDFNEDHIKIVVDKVGSKVINPSRLQETMLVNMFDIEGAINDLKFENV